MRRVEKGALIAVAVGGIAALGMSLFVRAFVEGSLNEVDESIAQLVNFPAGILANLMAGPEGPLSDALFVTLSAVQWFAIVAGAVYASLSDWARH